MNTTYRTHRSKDCTTAKTAILITAFIISIHILPGTSAQAQTFVSERFNHYDIGYGYGMPHQLSFDMNVLSFLRNAEYLMPYTVGYTSINCRLTPTLTYTINDRTRFTGGLQFDNIVGSDSIIHLYPYFRMEYEPVKWARIVLGDIYGGAEHGLEDPLYDRERNFFSYYYHPEAGVQIITSRNKWVSDTWIDWERYLNPWTYDQERFIMVTRHEFILKKDYFPHSEKQAEVWGATMKTGRTQSLTRHGATAAEMKDAPPKETLTATTLQLRNNAGLMDRVMISMPLTAMVAHRGGQFSLVDTNNESLFNFHAGLHLTLYGNQERTLQDLSTSTWSFYLPFYYFKDISGADKGSSKPYHHPFQNGWGVHPQLSWERSLFNTMRVPEPEHSGETEHREHYTYLSATLGYWHGHQYLSSRGSYLYQSACWTSDATFPERNMLTLDTRLEHRYKGFALGLDLQIYYDLNHHRSDYAYGLYMRWNILKRIFCE